MNIEWQYTSKGNFPDHGGQVRVLRPNRLVAIDYYLGNREWLTGKVMCWHELLPTKDCKDPNK